MPAAAAGAPVSIVRTSFKYNLLTLINFLRLCSSAVYFCWLLLVLVPHRRLALLCGGCVINLKKTEPSNFSSREDYKVDSRKNSWHKHIQRSVQIVCNIFHMFISLLRSWSLNNSLNGTNCGWSWFIVASEPWEPQFIFRASLGTGDSD